MRHSCLNMVIMLPNIDDVFFFDVFNSCILSLIRIHTENLSIVLRFFSELDLAFT